MNMTDAYLRRAPRRSWPRRCTASGPWADLVPLSTRGGERGEPIEILYGDEPVRQALIELGVHKADWEAIAPEHRQRVKTALRGLVVLRRACAAITEADLPDRQKRAAALVRGFNGWFAAQERRKSSFAFAGLRVESDSAARDAFLELAAVLRSLKKRLASLSHVTATDVTKAARDVNGVLEAQLFLKLPPLCTTADVRRLRTERPMVLAARLLQRAAPELVVDELLRGAPKKRR